MGWRYRKSKRVGPFLFTLTHRGLTTSIGGGGLRYVLGSPRRSIGRTRSVTSQNVSHVVGPIVLCILFLIAAGLFGISDSGQSVSTTASFSRDTSTTPLTDSNLAPDETAREVGSDIAVAFPKVTVGQAPSHLTSVAPLTTLPLRVEREPRYWVDVTGRHKTYARFVEAIGTTIYLQKHNGGTIAAIPIARLCSDDRDYISSERRQQVTRGQVTGITEGDLIAIRADRVYRIRLDGIDAPEKQQAFHEESRRALMDKLFRKNVRIEWNEKDTDGRILGHVVLDDRWINKELIDEGLAWHRGDSPVLFASEIEAKEARVGLWASNQAIPPWEFVSHPRQPKVEENVLDSELLRQREPRSQPTNSHVFAPTPTSQYVTPRYSSDNTVRVRGYFRKDGTYVRPHTRRPR